VVASLPTRRVGNFFPTKVFLLGRTASLGDVWSGATSGCEGLGGARSGEPTRGPPARALGTQPDSTTLRQAPRVGKSRTGATSHASKRLEKLAPQRRISRFYR
jgi:hypothetical protein